MGEVFVAGVGMLKFGRYKDKDVPELGGEAALLGARRRRARHRATWSSWPPAASCRRTRWSASASCSEIGQTGIPVVNVANACATGSTAFRDGVPRGRVRRVDVALAVGVEQMGKAGLLGGGGGVGHPHRGRHRQRAHAGGVRPGRHGAHAEVRHHAGAVREGRGEEPQARDAEPALAVPGRDAARAGDGARMVAYPNTLYMCCPTRRRRRGGGRRVGGEGARARREGAGAGLGAHVGPVVASATSRSPT